MTNGATNQKKYSNFAVQKIKNVGRVSFRFKNG